LQAPPDLSSDCRVIAEVLRRSGYSPERSGLKASGDGVTGWGAPDLLALNDRVNRRHHTVYSGPPGSTSAIFDEVRPCFDASYTAYLQAKHRAMQRMDNVGTSVVSIPRECKQWQ